MEKNNTSDETEDSQYYAIKCKLKSILKYPDMLQLIQNRVDAINKIWVETYFLFNQYVMKLLSDNKDVSIDYNIIERCALFVTNRSNSIRNKNNTLENLNDKIKKTSDEKIKTKLLREKERFESFNIIKDVYLNIYSKLGPTNLPDFKNIGSFGRPIGYLSRQIIVNIKNHLSLNFWKFQKLYIRGKILDKLTILKLPKNVINAIINCIQYHINSDYKNIVIMSKYIKKFKLKSVELYDKSEVIIKETIESEKQLVPSQIRNNVTISNLRNNYQYSLKYYYDMLKYLETNNKKRFSLLPQLSLGYTYMKFLFSYKTQIE